MMRSLPKFLRGAYKSAMRVALHEWEACEAAQSEVRKSRAWKLSSCCPECSCSNPTRGGLVAMSKMVERFKFFNVGRWEDLLLLSGSGTGVGEMSKTSSTQHRGTSSRTRTQSDPDGRIVRGSTGP